MSLESDFQEYILSQYKSVNQFATEAGIPYTTIKGGIERGIMGMSIQTVIKMCNILAIDVNKLGEGKVEPAKRNTLLSVEEFNLINQYRSVDGYGKSLITKVAAHEYERCTRTETIKIAARNGTFEARTVTDSEKQKMLDEFNQMQDVEDD